MKLYLIKMLLFGHIGISVFLGSLLYLSPLIVGASAILPDIIDKGLVLLGLSQYSRLFAHNLFFGPLASLVVYAVTRRKDFALAVLLGTYLHLVEDMKDLVPWLWPLATYDFAPVTGIKITLGLFEIIAETIGLTLLTFTFIFKHHVIYIREKIFALKDFYDKRFAKKV